MQFLLIFEWQAEENVAQRDGNSDDDDDDDVIGHSAQHGLFKNTAWIAETPASGKSLTTPTPSQSVRK